MKRRSFLKSLASMLIAVGVAREFGAMGIDAVSAPEEKKTRVAINPEWAKAPYEAVLMMHPAMLKNLLVLRQEAMRQKCQMPNYVIDPDAPRFRVENGITEAVPKFIAV